MSNKQITITRTDDGVHVDWGNIDPIEAEGMLRTAVLMHEISLVDAMRRPELDVNVAAPRDVEVQKPKGKTKTSCVTSSDPCCERADEYNGYGSDGPISFRCPKACSCHD